MFDATLTHVLVCEPPTSPRMRVIDCCGRLPCAVVCVAVLACDAAGALRWVAGAWSGVVAKRLGETVRISDAASPGTVGGAPYRRRMVVRPWGVLGVPSSVAAHWPGIEQAPAAMRAAGLIDQLRAADPDVVDHGDRPVARWVADRSDDRPNAWRRVVDVLVDARTALGAVIDAGRRPLVLGGECTVAIALVAAAVERFDDVGLVYVDGGQDLMIPTDHPEEPILDAMGVAHLLDLPGCVSELAAVGARRPLLRAADVVFVGFGDEEEDVHGLVPSTRISAPEVVLDPEAAAVRASAVLDHPHIVVHVDVDVVDAFDLPLADIATYGRGLRLAHLSRLLSVLLSDPRVVGMTLVEANPDHDPEGSSIARLVAALIGALGGAGGGAEARSPAASRSAR